MSTDSSNAEAQLEAQALEREWFYPFQLPSGAVTPTYDGGRLNAVHETRLSMMDSALKPLFGDGLDGASVVDLACHQGYFALQMAARGAGEILAVDARSSHVDDARLMAELTGCERFEALQSDIHDLDPAALGTFDVVLMLGLIYHLENPVGAIRQAQALTGKICLIETQVVPHLSGNVDWGNYRFVKPLQGCFGIIDETDETHGPEASTQGICLAPSTEGLVWIMHKVGFREVKLLEPPPDAYEQHRYGKRVMVAGLV
ncbi:MAG: DUF1698 domain-containing protein [Pseudomonadota bacterium]